MSRGLRRGSIQYDLNRERTGFINQFLFLKTNVIMGGHMRKFVFNILVCLFILIALAVTGCTGGGDSSSPTAQTYPAKALPVKFIVATAPTSGNSASAKERLDFVRSVAEKCKARGIQGVNLILDWRDIEPQQGAIDFGLLDNMIIEIKSRGLFCILRVYVNVEENWQAWPS